MNEATSTIGLSGVFGVAFVQSLGIPIPSLLVLGPMGVLVSRGDVALWQVIVVFISGQTLGDCLAYLLSKYAHQRVNRWFPRLYTRINHPIIRKLSARGPGMMLLLAYFLSWFRPVVSYLAPVLNIPFGQFLFWSFLRNVIGNGIYVAVMTGGVTLFFTNPELRPLLIGAAALVLIGIIIKRLRTRPPEKLLTEQGPL